MDRHVVTEWPRLLSRKVFFWVSERRVNELIGAQVSATESKSFSS